MEDKKTRGVKKGTKRGTYEKQTRICIVCGKEFQGSRKAKFCPRPANCKNKYHYGK